MDHFDTMNGKLSLDTNNKTLINIINSGRDDEAFRLLNSGKTFSQDDLDNALMLACNCKYKLLIYKLVHLGADVQTKDAHGNTPLLICAELRSTNVVRFLLRRKVNINAENGCGNTALILAIRPTGSIELVRLLLSQKGMNVHHQNKEGYTALMKAIQCKDIEVIKLLLDSQENTVKALDGIHNYRKETAQNIADKLGMERMTKLLLQYRVKERNQMLAAIQACDMISFNNMVNYLMSGSSNAFSIINDAFMGIFMAHEQSGATFNEHEETIIQRLLECGADVNGCSYQFHPVQVATQVGSYNVLQMLLKHGARLCKLALFWVCNNPLRVAVENGRSDLVELLLRNNSNLLVPKFGYSAVECALRNGHTHCAWLLVQHGAIMDVKYALSVPMRNKIPIYFMSLKNNSRPEVGQIVATSSLRGLIICAESRENVEMTGVCLPAEAVTNYVDKVENGPLNKSSKLAIVNFLTQRYVIVNKYRAKYRDYNSPIVRFLARNHHSDMITKENTIKSMLGCYSYVNKKSFGGRTPLMVAVSNGESSNLVEMLLKHGADIDAMDSKGNTVLLLAVETNITDNVLCLLQHACHRNILDFPNRQGLTPLMIATENHNYQMMEALIWCNASVNARDVNGNTALLLAVSRYSQELQILKSLINTESHVAWQNTCSISAYLVTGETSLKTAITLLVGSGADVNVVSKTAPHETALTLLLKNSSLDHHALVCVEYLLDHGAKASYATPDVIHRLIQRRKLQLIPKLIQCGCGPVGIRDFKILNNMSDVAISTVSPLCKALLMGNVKLARYFVGNLFMTSSDVTTLVQNQSLRLLLKSSNHLECLNFLDEVSAQPMSLFSVAFIAVQSAVGSAPGREDRVKMLPLPQMVIDKLLFKVTSITLDIPGLSVSIATVKMPSIDPVRAVVPGDIHDGDSYESYNYVAHEVDSSDDDYLVDCNEL